MKELMTFLVEDSPVIRDSLIATLEDLATVKVVGTSLDEASAVEWLTQPENACDLAIVDIFLKQGSGLGVLSMIKKKRHQMKTVVFSNYVTPDIKRKCKELGADRVFDKSDEIEELILYCSKLSRGEVGNSGMIGLS
jgi:DNA-binding NarL/FixJ family response regulator